MYPIHGQSSNNQNMLDQLEQTGQEHFRSNSKGKDEELEEEATQDQKSTNSNQRTLFDTIIYNG